MPEVNEIPVNSARETALKLMRKPFEAHQISKMCKATKKDNPPGRCNACGGWHKLPSVQLSYVGHAALTDRLLDADPGWTWEPLSFAADGSPFLDANGGLWIKLTVAGVTRLGYGDAQGKVGGDAMKERIGDALRNAGMRFGAALDLWHKGDLHLEVADEPVFEKQPDGNFVRKPDSVANTPNIQPPVTGSLAAAAKPETKRAGRPKKESVPDAGKPWGGGFEPKTATTPGSPVPTQVNAVGPLQVNDALNIHGVTITDADVPFPGDPEPKPEVPRIPTETERKVFMARLIKLKDKGFTGIREWLLKESGVQITNDIPHARMSELVDKLEAAEKAGSLKNLLEGK